jgi:predicted nucleotidyltransferase
LNSVEEAVLYGSRAMGNYRKGSDIDLTLKGRNLSISDLFKLENEIDDLMLPYKFDFSIFSHIKNQDLIEHIARNGKLFYKKDEDKPDEITSYKKLSRYK